MHPLSHCIVPATLPSFLSGHLQSEVDERAQLMQTWLARAHPAIHSIAVGLSIISSNRNETWYQCERMWMWM